MALGKYDSRAATVLCPILFCGTRIFKDRAAYAAHMVNVHSATDTVFADTGIRGIGGYDRKNGEVEEAIFKEEESLLWCGCDSTFRSLSTPLLGHLSNDHDVDIGGP